MRSPMTIAALLFGVLAGSVAAQTLPADSSPVVPGAIIHHDALPNGISFTTANGFMEHVEALHDNVLRVRISRTQELPEDASWAVLPESRSSSVVVIAEDGVDTIGFRTGKLHVEIARSDARLTVRDANGNIVQQDAAPPQFENSAFRVFKSMPTDEHYFGLGDKTGPLDRRGHSYSMWNTDAYRFQESTDPLYKDIPLFMTYCAGSAVGVFFDNTWRSSFDFGVESPSRYSFGAVAGPLDYYIFLGPTPREVVETYAWLTGKPPLPPRWMLGFQQSRYTYTPEARLMEVARRLRADRIPTDALYLDIDFQDRHRPFTVDKTAFPDVTKMLATLHEMHFHVVAITDLHIADAPNQGYVPFDSGSSGNQFLRWPDGSAYVGSVWPGPSVFPDFTQSTTREWWGTLYKPFTQAGFDGFWNDMNEPSVFNTPTNTIDQSVLHRIDEKDERLGFAPRRATHAELHNVYGMENSRATYDGLRKLEPDVRPFVLTRASYAGGQRYAATWTGDNSSTWNHLRMSVPMLKSLGVSGFSFSGADVSGFAGTANYDLLTKWIEIAAFEPIDRDHSEKGTGDKEPWVGGEKHEKIRRHYIEERYKLMPYLYTLADEAAQTGLPMMRPLFLDYPDATRDKHAIDLDGGVEAEFLLGHDLLIAPSPYPEAPDAYTVEFPSAEWFNYWTGERVNEPASAHNGDPNGPAAATDQVALYTVIHPELESVPVFVRAGAILPLGPAVQNTDETPQGPLTLRVYAGDDCKGSLYTDDGKSFSYLKGAYLRMNFGCSMSSSGMQLHISKHEGSYTPWWKEIRIEVYGWKSKHGRILEDGRAINAVISNEATHFELTIPDSGQGTSLSFE
jgi:alpha-glucosidase